MQPYEPSGYLPERVCREKLWTLPLRGAENLGWPRAGSARKTRRRSGENIGVRSHNRRARSHSRNEDPTKKCSQSGLAISAPEEIRSGSVTPIHRRSELRRRTGRLCHHLLGGLHHFPAAVVPTALAHPVHDLRIPTVVALHKLGRFQLVVVRRTALLGAGLRMSSFRDSHGSVFRQNERVVRFDRSKTNTKNLTEAAPIRCPVFRDPTSFRSEFTLRRRVRPEIGSLLFVLELFQVAPSRIDGFLVGLLLGGPKLSGDGFVLGVGGNATLRN